jgi:hypothetical protein
MVVNEENAHAKKPSYPGILDHRRTGPALAGFAAVASGMVESRPAERRNG